MAERRADRADHLAEELVDDRQRLSVFETDGRHTDQRRVWNDPTKIVLSKRQLLLRPT